MSPTDQERTIRDRVPERPRLDVGKIAGVRRRDLIVRFAAGALTSILAGAASLVFGARVGGTMLAFPAILAASLTLIEEQEDSVHAREDARGAVLGGSALAAFAATAALALGAISGVLALALAATAWLAVALIGYAILWLG
jgi:hypothetical protein